MNKEQLRRRLATPVYPIRIPEDLRETLWDRSLSAAHPELQNLKDEVDSLIDDVKDDLKDLADYHNGERVIYLKHDEVHVFFKFRGIDYRIARSEPYDERYCSPSNAALEYVRDSVRARLDVEEDIKRMMEWVMEGYEEI